MCWEFCGTNWSLNKSVAMLSSVFLALISVWQLACIARVNGFCWLLNFTASHYMTVCLGPLRLITRSTCQSSCLMLLPLSVPVWAWVSLLMKCIPFRTMTTFLKTKTLLSAANTSFSQPHAWSYSCKESVFPHLQL